MNNNNNNICNIYYYSQHLFHLPQKLIIQRNMNIWIILCLLIFTDLL